MTLPTPCTGEAHAGGKQTPRGSGFQAQNVKLVTFKLHLDLMHGLNNRLSEIGFKLPQKGWMAGTLGFITLILKYVC